MSTALSSLKDIPGVFGSFVFSPEGELTARDMPAVYPNALFGEISRRLEGIAQAMEPVMEGFYELLAKFDGHWLLSRRTTKGTLNILADESVNFPALKMAANVAVKNLDKLQSTVFEPEAAPVEPAAPEVPVPQAAAAVPAVSAPDARPRRIWRGQVVE